jgi:hypothetical protein
MPEGGAEALKERFQLSEILILVLAGQIWPIERRWRYRYSRSFMKADTPRKSGLYLLKVLA